MRAELTRKCHHLMTEIESIGSGSCESVPDQQAKALRTLEELGAAIMSAMAPARDPEVCDIRVGQIGHDEAERVALSIYTSYATDADVILLSYVRQRKFQDTALRKLLWLRHGCPVTALYGDDGEMQCSACLVDFLRSNPLVIEARLNRLATALGAQL